MEAFAILGIAIRTTNENDQSSKDIPVKKINLIRNTALKLYR
jgi:hypothetical protein